MGKSWGLRVCVERETPRDRVDDLRFKSPLGIKGERQVTSENVASPIWEMMKPIRNYDKASL